MDANSRRRFIQTLGAGSLAWYLTPGAYAQELIRTPRQTEGPFYPDRMPLDTDNDLLILNDAITPAVGAITHLTGRILGPTGAPVRNAVVEIWQVDNNGAYIHSKDTNHSKRDTNFQGFGRFMTGSTGEYYFRTIKPVPYPGRTPHIHFAILQSGKRMLTSQLYIQGESRNESDSIYKSIRDVKARNSITVPFVPLRDSKIGELMAKFDIVIGETPEDPQGDSFRRRS